MAKKTWTLTDVDSDQYLETLSVTPGMVGGAASGYSVTKRTLRGGRRDGVDVIEVDNGAFRFVIVPTRGMGLWKAAMGPIQLGWKSPVKGPVHPAFVHLESPHGLGWLEGFDELLVRCGLESNGPPEYDDKGRLRHPLHGRIANIPAHKVELSIDGDVGQISVTGEVDEARLFGNKLRLTSTYTTRVGQPGLTMVDTVTNLSAEVGELELLYHTNFGMPLVTPGAKVVVPIVKMAPATAVAASCIDQWDVYEPETPGSMELVYLFDLAGTADGFTRALLRNAAGDQGVSLRFNKNQLPCFTLWKNRQAGADGYVTGLEPAINFPMVRSFEKQQGRVATLAPGESRSFEYTIEVHPSAESVTAAEQAVAALQKDITPQVLRQPDPQWSPVG